MTGREESALAWLREYWEANSEWRIARSHDWPSAGRHAMQMRRAMNALRYFGLVRKTRPLPSVESYMAHLWKKYYPESQA
jgi:hypothetical protein